jgi:two-component SAPR family response regulator
MIELQKLLELMIEKKASDLHITTGALPRSGLGLAKRLESLRPEMKVIYISGYTDNAVVHHGVLKPGMNYIQKPFTIEGLARKVREVLDK